MDPVCSCEPAVWLLQSFQFAALVMAARGVIDGKLKKAGLRVYLPLLKLRAGAPDKRLNGD